MAVSIRAESRWGVGPHLRKGTPGHDHVSIRAESRWGVGLECLGLVTSFKKSQSALNRGGGSDGLPIDSCPARLVSQSALNRGGGSDGAFLARFRAGMMSQSALNRGGGSDEDLPFADSPFLRLNPR